MNCGWGDWEIPKRKSAHSYIFCVTVTGRSYHECSQIMMYNKKGGELMTNSKMNSQAASRIQSAADKTGTNSGFKARAQSAAAKNERK